MSLQSWTLHQNPNGVVVTLRFIDPLDKPGALDSTKVHKWKKSSSSSIKRDRERMTRYNESQKQKLRKSKRIEEKNTENVRCADNELIQLSVPVSPATVDSDMDSFDSVDSQFHLSTQSPHACDMGNLASPVESAHLEQAECISMPTTPSNSLDPTINIEPGGIIPSEELSESTDTETSHVPIMPVDCHCVNAWSSSYHRLVRGGRSWPYRYPIRPVDYDTTSTWSERRNSASVRWKYCTRCYIGPGVIRTSFQ